MALDKISYLTKIIKSTSTLGHEERRPTGRQQGRPSRTTRGAPLIPGPGGEPEIQTSSPPLSPGRRGGATAQSALG
eukprot:scaffold19371_cov57-Phaeocystis_antarctica.AAC.1